MSRPLWCPFSSSLSPLAEQVNAQTAQWAYTQHLVKSEQEVEKLLRAQIGGLVGRGFPKASREHLQLIADWTTYFCLLDDRVDAPGTHPLFVGSYLSSLLSAFEEEASAPHAEPLTAALLGLKARMRGMCSLEWIACFTERLRELFTAFSWESFYRYSKTTPDLETYLRLRQVTVGIQLELLFFDLTSPCEETTLSQKASNLIGWQNDIFTYEKELAQGETLNLIIVLMRTEGLSRTEAEERAILLHNEEVKRFLEEAQDSTADPGQLEAIQAWIGGHIEWARETGRYQSSPQSTQEERRATA